MNAMRWMFLAVGLVVLGPSFAHQDRIAPWTTVTLEAIVHDQPTRVIVRSKSTRLTQLAILHGKRSIKIPQEALADLPSPQLNTIVIGFDTLPGVGPSKGIGTSDEGPKSQPYFYVELQYGVPMEVGEPPYPESEIVFPRVQFFIVDGEYRERWFHKPVSRGQSRLETDCTSESRAKRKHPCLLPQQ
jgi:hypothetical protein